MVMYLHALNLYLMHYYTPLSGTPHLQEAPNMTVGRQLTIRTPKEIR